MPSPILSQSRTLGRAFMAIPRRGWGENQPQQWQQFSLVSRTPTRLAQIRPVCIADRTLTCRWDSGEPRGGRRTSRRGGERVWSFLAQLIENARQGPLGLPVVVPLKFPRVRDVPDVIAASGCVHVISHRHSASSRGAFIQGFSDGAVKAAPADVVDLAGSGVGGKEQHGFHEIVGVDVATNLLSGVSDDLVGLAFLDAVGEMAEEAVLFDAFLVGADDASWAEDADREAEVLAVFLGEHVAGQLGAAEK